MSGNTFGRPPVRTLFLSGILALAALQAVADEIHVSHLYSFDVRRLELKRGETADIEVILHGGGQAVGKYRVFLTRPGESGYLATALSDENGQLRFAGVPAGDYVLVVRHREDDPDAFIEIGDVVLSPSKAAPPKSEERESE